MGEVVYESEIREILGLPAFEGEHHKRGIVVDDPTAWKHDLKKAFSEFSKVYEKYSIESAAELFTVPIFSKEETKADSLQEHELKEWADSMLNGFEQENISLLLKTYSKSIVSSYCLCKALIARKDALSEDGDIYDVTTADWFMRKHFELAGL